MPSARRCLTCGLVFGAVQVLREHCSSYLHSFNPHICNPCNRSFGDIRALQNHLNSSKHASDLAVGLSPDAFMDGRDGSVSGTIGGSAEHVTIDTQHICSVCHQTYKSARGLEQHMASLAHSRRILKCPFCNVKLKSPSGMAMHLEDTCKSKITRHQVTRAAHSMGFTPNISIDGRIGGAQSSQSSQLITTMNFFSSPMTSQLLATEASFNGSYYQCPFLQCLQRKFNDLCALNKHLSSPVHDENQFKCPGCFTEFKLISGFIQHVEGHTCINSVSAAFEQIEAQIDSLADFFSENLVV